MLDLPQEIWDNIVQDLPSFTVKNAADVFHFELRKQVKHSEVWRLVFHDKAWVVAAQKAGLNPILIGSDLEALYNRGSYKSAYICICIGGYNQTFTYSDKNKALFYQCLQPHTQIQSSLETGSSEKGFTLNIDAAMFGTEIDVNPAKVISERSHNVFRTYAMFWDDKAYDIRELNTTSIDMSREGKSLGIKLFKCGLSFLKPDGSQQKVTLHWLDEARRLGELQTRLLVKEGIIQEESAQLFQFQKDFPHAKKWQYHS